MDATEQINIPFGDGWGVAAMEPRNQPKPEVDKDAVIGKLRTENANLRRRLAHITAQYLWVEGKDFAEINMNIREFGFQLSTTETRNGRDPRIVPITP